MARHIGGKAAFIAYGHTHAFVMQYLFERMEHLCPLAQGLFESGCTHRNNHELLQVQVVIGMRAAVDHIHHGNRHLHCRHAAKVAVQRKAGFLCRRAGHRHGHGQHRVSTQATFVFGAVQVNQGLVQESLLGRI